VSYNPTQQILSTCADSNFWYWLIGNVSDRQRLLLFQSYESVVFEQRILNVENFTITLCYRHLQDNQVKVTPIKGVPRASVSNPHVEVPAGPSSFTVVHPVVAIQSQTIVQRSIVHPFKIHIRFSIPMGSGNCPWLSMM
jgi:hypothetical protein